MGKQGKWVRSQFEIHKKEYHKILCVSIYLFDIIRMEREDIEKAGVRGLMSGVQGMEIGSGRAGILEKEGYGTINEVRHGSAGTFPELHAQAVHAPSFFTSSSP